MAFDEFEETFGDTVPQVVREEIIRESGGCS